MIYSHESWAWRPFWSCRKRKRREPNYWCTCTIHNSQANILGHLHVSEPVQGMQGGRWFSYYGCSNYTTTVPLLSWKCVTKMACHTRQGLYTVRLLVHVYTLAVWTPWDWIPESCWSNLWFCWSNPGFAYWLLTLLCCLLLKQSSWSAKLLVGNSLVNNARAI